MPCIEIFFAFSLVFGNYDYKTNKNNFVARVNAKNYNSMIDGRNIFEIKHIKILETLPQVKVTIA